MPSMLLEIQETVEKYADIMSKVAQVEVEVVDENLFRVAGTGFFSEHVNEDMSEEGYVYQHILHTGSSITRGRKRCARSAREKTGVRRRSRSPCRSGWGEKPSAS